MTAQEPVRFAVSPKPTVGIEIELGLVDQHSMALASVAPQLLARLPSEFEGSVKPELMQCVVEINSCVCSTIQEAKLDLTRKLLAVQTVADELGARILWSATHPFSTWREQRVTDNIRYQGLVGLLQDTARQLVTFGLHVHVGVDSGGKAIMICDRILRHLPTLLAASSNSPFWEGSVTGMHSWRSKVMDSLPTAGLPPRMRNWSEYVWVVHHLVDTGYIDSIRELWWDVRPHHNFGTVEVRICDCPGSLDDALALAALVQCLVTALSEEIDRGTYRDDYHPMMIRQNKWRAARYGLDAQLVQGPEYELQAARETLAALVQQMRPTATQLGCTGELEEILRIASHPTSAERQLQIFKSTKDPAEVVRQLTAETRV